MNAARASNSPEPKHEERHAKNSNKKRKLALAYLREQRGLTQAKLARRAKITQSEVSRTELRDDCFVSTLERYAAALGGKLRIHIEIDGHLYSVTR